jgi:diguanylate cyclase (GGDEF)-like protein
LAGSLRVLLVEDSEDDALAIVRELRRADFDVDAKRVENAAQLAAELGVGAWDVILSDYHLRALRAPEALAIARSVDPDVPFIVVSGSISEEEAADAIRAGARDYLAKGKLPRLAATIRRELAESETRRAQRIAAQQLYAAEQLRLHQATHDRLTGLLNRSTLEERMEQEIANATDEQSTLAVLYLNLDRFNEIELTLGHVTGDAVLVQVARRLGGPLGASDLLARVGGDEFALVLPRTDAARANEVAKALLETISEPMRAGQVTIAVEAAVGISVFPGHGKESGTLLRAAAVAMRTARASGARYARYSADQDPYDPSILELTGDLRTAIAENQLFLEFQPCIDLRQRRAIAVEALARWRHPTNGPIAPSRFVPIAERTGLIRPMTHWVLNEALRQCRGWRDAGIGLKIAVNISASTLHDPEIVDRVRDASATWGVDGRQIELEITESAIMKDPARSAETIRRMSESGASVAIDDFGTGYSSLSALRHYRFSKIKIDQSFVIGMVKSEDDTAIVRAIIELSQALGLAVQAEGVEDLETLKRLASMGCQLAQGYYIAKPMSDARLRLWLAESPYGAVK